MYDHIAGKVLSVQPALVVLRASGVGYRLQVPMGVSTSLTEGTEACLYTILHVADGNPSLLGFHQRGDRDFARVLMSVSGVGPAMGLAILSTYTIEQIATAIVSNDHALLQKVKGVGKKIAERLCLELRDKVGKLHIDGFEPSPSTVLIPPSCEDAIAALITLGYSERDAQKRVQGFHDREPSAGSEELIKLVLRS